MFALFLLGIMFVSAVHGSGEPNVPLELDYNNEMITGMAVKPVNGTFGSHKYYIPIQYSTWMDSVTYCTKNGGTLTDVRSLAELEFLQGLCKMSGGRYAFWVGAAAMGKHEEYTWISDKTKVGKELWKKGEPQKEIGNCVVFKWGEGAPVLAVYDCNIKENRKFICKFEAK